MNILTGLMDSALKNSYYYKSLSVTAAPFSPNYYFKEKSSYLPVPLVVCCLLYSCSVSQFLFIRLAVLLFLSFSPSLTHPSSSWEQTPIYVLRRVYYSVGWSIDFCRSRDQRSKSELKSTICR